MIDLHTHTDESDGTLTPADLVEAASRIHLEALAITDHDTFSGYDQAAALRPAFDLVCGIELSTSYQRRSVHLLGYFLNGGPSAEFRSWITGLQEARHRRNLKLVDKLQSQGFDVTIAEVRWRAKSLPGRPHFASVMAEKGYVTSRQQAFDLYLGESGTCYVRREDPSFSDGVQHILAGGGVPSLAHPMRVTRDPAVLETYVREMKGMGLKAIEVHHSDHFAEDRFFLELLAKDLSLAPTGGSDFHGEAKPNIALGSVQVPIAILENLRRL